MNFSITSSPVAPPRSTARQISSRGGFPCAAGRSGGNVPCAVGRRASDDRRCGESEHGLASRSNFSPAIPSPFVSPWPAAHPPVLHGSMANAAAPSSSPLAIRGSARRPLTGLLDHHLRDGVSSSATWEGRDGVEKKGRTTERHQ